MPKRKVKAPPLPSWSAYELELVNDMDRSTDALVVATAALVHAAMTRRPVADYHGALRASERADVVLAALYRRGMLNV
jgi:hypothetical protein